MAAMTEFAGILFLQRRNRLIRTDKVASNQQMVRRGSFEMEGLTAKIDLIALTLFCSGYLVFNVAFWAMYLM